MYEICALGNAPVDLLYSVSDEFLTKYGIEKGNWNPREAVTDIKQMTEELEALDFTMEAGGSVANSLHMLGMFDHQSFLIATLGEDPAGTFFKQSMNDIGCETTDLTDGVNNLQIAVLVTPDGQRSFVPAKPLPTTPSKQDVQNAESKIADAEYLIIEGYVLDGDQEGVFEALHIAKKHKTKVILTLSAPFMVAKHATAFAQIVKEGVNMIIANEEEIAQLLKAYDDNHDRSQVEALENDIMFTPRVVTHGKAGATYIDRLHHLLVPCIANNTPKDTTGAGDAFMAGFLHGILDEHPIETALHYGHKCAQEVIGVLGGRYHKKIEL